MFWYRSRMVEMCRLADDELFRPERKRFHSVKTYPVVDIRSVVVLLNMHHHNVVAHKERRALQRSVNVCADLTFIGVNMQLTRLTDLFVGADGWRV
jgi:hypothetical protein